jgi:hypothetical protein
MFGDDVKEKRSDFARRMRLRRPPLTSHPAFDLTHEIVLLNRKTFQTIGPPREGN